MENNVKENNNKGIIIVLIVVIIGLVLFIGYDKLIKKDTNNNSNSNSVSNSSSGSSPLIFINCCSRRIFSS